MMMMIKGKKMMAVCIVKYALEIIHLVTDKNPIQVYPRSTLLCMLHISQTLTDILTGSRVYISKKVTQ